jgi:D-alanyl-D-alanine endopeptidase (penicillin-binding protein 7)
MYYCRCNETSPGIALLSKTTIVFIYLCFGLLLWCAQPARAKSHHHQTRSHLKVASLEPVHSTGHRHVKASYKVKRLARTKAKRKHRGKGIKAKAVYCVNLASNRTLVSRNPDAQLPVASLTKLVTALVVLDQMPLSRKVRVPKYIKRIPKSVVGLRPGDRVSVLDLLHGMLMQSGNDCAETLARSFPGGRRQLIKKMNIKARAMGTKRTLFYTVSGLDKKLVRKKSAKKRSVRIISNVSTAREIARIARFAFANRLIRSICMKRSHVMTGANSRKRYRITNTNKLLKCGLPIRAGKTGYTARAGRCLATAFTPGRDVFVIVVLGSTDHFRDTRLIYRKALKKAIARRSRLKRTRHSRQITWPQVAGS